MWWRLVTFRISSEVNGLRQLIARQLSSDFTTFSDGILKKLLEIEWNQLTINGAATSRSMLLGLASIHCVEAENSVKKYLKWKMSQLKLTPIQKLKQKLWVPMLKAEQSKKSFPLNFQISVYFASVHWCELISSVLVAQDVQRLQATFRTVRMFLTTFLLLKREWPSCNQLQILRNRGRDWYRM